MVKVVGVRFKHAGKIYYFDPGEIKLTDGDSVIVETVRGVEYGDVVVPPKEIAESAVVQPLKQVLRRATEEDVQIVRENAAKETTAFQIGLEKIEKHGLPMKLVDVEYTFDNSKVIFYFTADGRVDFRDLVKDLASVFRTRIELRQIGVRDQAKMLGGLGPCGRSMCCATFLGDFEPVSIKMAKEQNLSLNPSKISGICGRLMCCLKFETEVYRIEKEESEGETTGEAPTGSRGKEPVKSSQAKSASRTEERRKAEAPLQEKVSSKGEDSDTKSPDSEGSASTTPPKGNRTRKRRYRRPRNRPKQEQSKPEQGTAKK
ncbi:MAG: stage 0 sporulation family protein [Firmicutes bacterium]|jgi:cell fate regulator YaaT (PSP1 superfamily)|nr:stage 0 sporulation family protein [Bacillota bacterium]